MPRDREFIDQLMELSYDPCFVINAERRIVACNEQFTSMLGLSARQRRSIDGTAFDSLLDLDSTGSASITDCLQTDSNVRVQSVTAHTKAGASLVLDMSALPLRDDAGAVTGVVVLQRDVTDEQRLREKYDQLVAESKAERESLLRIIRDRDAEIERLELKVERGVS